MIIDKSLILSQEKIADSIYALTLRTAIAPLAKCGQFVQVAIPGFFLRRPISIAKIDNDSISLIYRIVGDGTRRLSQCACGETLDLFGPLGNGFPLTQKEVILIGGGIGVPPLYETAKSYIANGTCPTVVLGFNNAASSILCKEFENLGCPTFVATMDGSLGTKGTVVDVIAQHGLEGKTALACGPMAMLRAVSEIFNECYVSLEARMACGMGTCNGCVIKNAQGKAVRICRDGPVFPGKEVF